jgi:hypothetical protein
MQSIKPVSPQCPLARIEDLRSGGALTDFQANRLIERWDDLPYDWHRDPYFHQVGEHSVAYINQWRQRQASARAQSR